MLSLIKLTSLLLAVAICSTSRGDIILDLDESTFRAVGPTDYLIDGFIHVDDVGNADLTTKTRASGVNILFAFDQVRSGIKFSGMVAPSDNAVFPNAAYVDGGELQAYTFASISSNSPAADPFLNNGRLFSLQLTIPETFQGSFRIDLLADDTIFHSDGAATFFTDSTAKSIAFDDLSGATIHVSTVPEPSSLAFLIGAGAVAVCSRRKRGDSQKS